MSRLAGTIRFVLGTGMVAAGVALALPLSREVVRGVAASGVVVGAPAAEGCPAPPAPAATPPTATPSVPWPDPGVELAAGSAPAALRADYAPPVPPERLPPVGAALGASGPALDATYRSTLDVPPPPLLDTHAPPPPAVAWNPVQQLRNSPERVMPAALVPATCTVRDGDDLTGIAIRHYGHADAAAAIWAANRDVLADPNLLPIGVRLRLPPPWSIGVGARLPDGGGVRAIEPPFAGADDPAPRFLPVSASPPVGVPWLGDAPPPVAPARPAAIRAGTVRVAPGDTLASLAQKFYGDPSAARRIWEANQDLLRSPELVVPGMELRLP